MCSCQTRYGKDFIIFSNHLFSLSHTLYYFHMSRQFLSNWQAVAVTVHNNNSIRTLSIIHTLNSNELKSAAWDVLS